MSGFGIGSGTYGGVAQMALGDGLEERRLSHVGQPDLIGCLWSVLQLNDTAVAEKTHDSTLQVVARPAQQELVLLCGFLGRHLLLLRAVLFGVGTGGGGVMPDGAAKQDRLELREVVLG